MAESSNQTQDHEAHHDPHAAPARDESPSETMSALGIVQDGEPILRRTAVRFDLPGDRADAQRVLAELHAAADRVMKIGRAHV